VRTQGLRARRLSALAECRALGTAPDISIHRATAIMAVARAWTVLAQHVAHYDAIVNAENK
jgi:hypothetical protein